MELLVRIPAGFSKREKPDGIVYMAPGNRWGIFVTPMTPAQPDPAAWSARAAEFRAPPGVAVRVVVTSAFTTDEGWPVSLLEAQVGPERRIVAYLHAFDYCAGIISRCKDPEAEEEWRVQTMEIITGARVDLVDARAGVACLADLLGGVTKQAVGSAAVVD